MNYCLVNSVRQSLVPPKVEEPAANIGDSYDVSVEKYLHEHCTFVERMEDTYKSDYNNDVFMSYYNIDKEVMDKVGMENIDKLEHRFYAWKITR